MGYSITRVEGAAAGFGHDVQATMRLSRKPSCPWTRSHARFAWAAPWAPQEDLGEDWAQAVAR